MTAIILGSGSTLKTITVESHLLEILTLLRNEENKPASNPNNNKFVTASYDLNNFLTSITFSIPASQQINELGQSFTVVNDYLINTGFNAGINGTFKSQTLCQYLLELLTYTQILEDDANKNPQLANNTSWSFDADEKKLTGTVNLPIGLNFNDNGQPVIFAKEYLL